MNSDNNILMIKNIYKVDYLFGMELGKTHLKKGFFCGRTTKVLPYTNGSVVDATFFLIIAGLKRILKIFSFPSNFWAKTVVCC